VLYDRTVQIPGKRNKGGTHMQVKEKVRNENVHRISKVDFKTCPRCNGQIYQEWDDLVCLQCGYRRYEVKR